MLVKVGDPIQLNLQLEDGATNKFPQAILRNQSGVLLSGSPVSLTHVGDGLYQNDSIAMPNTQEVTATYKVYDDAGHTVLSQFYSIELDVFGKDNASELVSNLKQLAGDLTGELNDYGAVEAFLDDTGGVLGDIDDSGSLEGHIEEFELTGILVNDGELIGAVASC